MKELIRLIRHKKIKALFRARTHNTSIQFFRYVFVGSLASITDMVCLWLFYSKLGFKEYIAVALAFICGLIVNYILSMHFVFVGVSRHHEHTIKFSVYYTIGSIGLVLTELLMYLFDTMIGFHYILAKLLTSLLIFIWNFTAKKHILYKKPIDED